LDEDDLQADSDAGASQESGSTPEGSNVEVAEPQEEEEEQPEEDGASQHYHNLRNGRERALKVITTTNDDGNDESSGAKLASAQSQKFSIDAGNSASLGRSKRSSLGVPQGTVSPTPFPAATRDTTLEIRVEGADRPNMSSTGAQAGG
jgi:hypothetical protein